MGPVGDVGATDHRRVVENHFACIIKLLGVSRANKSLLCPPPRHRSLLNIVLILTIVANLGDIANYELEFF